jgi:hypothetical protein
MVGWWPGQSRSRPIHTAAAVAQVKVVRAQPQPRELVRGVQVPGFTKGFTAFTSEVPMILYQNALFVPLFFCPWLRHESFVASQCFSMRSLACSCIDLFTLATRNAREQAPQTSQHVKLRTTMFPLPAFEINLDEELHILA